MNDFHLFIAKTIFVTFLFTVSYYSIVLVVLHGDRSALVVYIIFLCSWSPSFLGRLWGLLIRVISSHKVHLLLPWGRCCSASHEVHLLLPWLHISTKHSYISGHCSGALVRSRTKIGKSFSVTRDSDFVLSYLFVSLLLWCNCAPKYIMGVTRDYYSLSRIGITYCHLQWESN